MKKVLIILVIATITAILSIVVRKANSILSNSNDFKPIGVTIQNSLPNFQFKTLENKFFSKENLNSDKSTIIVHFDPDCESCEKSAILFGKFTNILEGSNVLFVSSSEMSKIRSFGKEYKLDKISNIKLLQSDVNEFYSLFNELSTPAYFIYNKSGKKIKLINEQVPGKILIRYIKASQLD